MRGQRNSQFYGDGGFIAGLALGKRREAVEDSRESAGGGAFMETEFVFPAILTYRIDPIALRRIP